MNTREDGSIYEFEEKPKHPKSTNASMGIYIFKWSVLKKFLIEDEENPRSENDFGKNVIPAILNEATACSPMNPGLLEGRRHDQLPVGGQHGPAGQEPRLQPLRREGQPHLCPELRHAVEHHRPRVEE